MTLSSRTLSFYLCKSFPAICKRVAAAIIALADTKRARLSETLAYCPSFVISNPIQYQFVFWRCKKSNIKINTYSSPDASNKQRTSTKGRISIWIPVHYPFKNDVYKQRWLCVRNWSYSEIRHIPVKLRKKVLYNNLRCTECLPSIDVMPIKYYILCSVWISFQVYQVSNILLKDTRLALRVHYSVSDVGLRKNRFHLSKTGELCFISISMI